MRLHGPDSGRRACGIHEREILSVAMTTADTNSRGLNDLKNRIVFVGQDYWVTHLAAGLRVRNSETVVADSIGFDEMTAAPVASALRLARSRTVVRVGFLPGDSSVLAHPFPKFQPPSDSEQPTLRARMKRSLFQSRAGRALQRIVLMFRHGTVVPKSMATDLACRLAGRSWARGRYFYYWIGTDVLIAAQTMQQGSLARPEMNDLGAAKHIAGAAHLAHELREAGIPAEAVPFPGIMVAVPSGIPAFPARMTVASYVPDSRRDFYGLPALLNAARALPDVQFVFFNGTGEGVGDIPPNAKFLGRVDDISEVYSSSSVVIRLVEHDSIGATVIEGLLYGRQVLYSYELPHTTYVSFGNEQGLVAALRGLEEMHTSGGIPPNTAGRDWAIEEFDLDRRFKLLLDALTC